MEYLKIAAYSERAAKARKEYQINKRFCVFFRRTATTHAIICCVIGVLLGVLFGSKLVEWNIGATATLNAANALRAWLVTTLTALMTGFVAYTIGEAFSIAISAKFGEQAEKAHREAKFWQSLLSR